MKRKDSSTESLFNTLKAENEPWLGDVFVAPSDFNRLTEKRSTILYGEAGSGKTALRLELMRGHREGIFTVLWMPEPILENPASGTALAHQAMRQALRACVESMILEGSLSQRLGQPSIHISSALKWLLQKYLPFDPVFYIQSQMDRLRYDEAQWYLKLLEQTFPPIITEQTSLRDQTLLLLTILRQAKYDQLWLMIDGIERWASLQVGDQVTALLDATLSTLVIFDVPGVVYKFFLPVSLKGVLHRTTGVERHRAEEIQLKWTAESLQTILEKRMAFAFSSPKVSMDFLYKGDEFLNWLKEFGGDSPREWIQFAGPLLSEYQKHGKRLTVTQMREFIHQHPAPLRLHHERREVWLGKKCIPIGSATEFRVLECLSAQPGKICSLEELYYCALAERDSLPDKGDPKWVPQKIWRGPMDTLVWRLRQKIEQNPKEPIYLITHHGKGLELHHLAL